MAQDTRTTTPTPRRRLSRAVADILEPWAARHGFVRRARRKGEGTMMFPLGSFARGGDPAAVIEPQFDKYGRPRLRLNAGREIAIWTAEGRQGAFLDGHFHLPRSPGFGLGPGVWERLVGITDVTIQRHAARLPALLDEAARWFAHGEVGPHLWPVPANPHLADCCLRLAAFRVDPEREVMRVLAAIIRLETWRSGPIAPNASLEGNGLLRRDDDLGMAAQLEHRFGIRLTSPVTPADTLADLAKVVIAELRNRGIERSAPP